MDKYEYKIKAEEINNLIQKGDFEQAAEIADTIDWRRVKSVAMLCTISDVYKMNRRFDEAKDLLEMAYDRHPGSRTICYSLCELTIKTQDYVQAFEYYKQFVQIAPKDPGKYILKYKIYTAQDVSIEERIDVLKELKAHNEYHEKWLYELAYLYHRLGLVSQCVDECDDLITMFGSGKYVIKAMELKKLHQPLSPEQQKKYIEFAAELAKEDPSGETFVEPNFDDTKIYEKKSVSAAVEQTPKEAEDVFHSAMREEPGEENAVVTDKTIVMPESIWSYVPETEIGKGETGEEIQVKVMDPGYNTINLQETVAEGIREYLEGTNEESAKRPMQVEPAGDDFSESDTESLDFPEISSVSDEDLESESGQDVIERTEVFFGDTSEFPEASVAEAMKKSAEEKQPEEQDVDKTASVVMEQLRLENISEAAKQAMTAQPPKAMASVLSQGYDGQISLIVPETQKIEKQITGQLNLDDILVEWERLKRENAEKNEEAVSRHVKEQTGEMFTEFEASLRDSLLEKLEKGEEDEQEKTEEPTEFLDEDTEDTVDIADGATGEEHPSEADRQEETQPETETAEERESMPEAEQTVAGGQKMEMSIPEETEVIAEDVVNEETEVVPEKEAAESKPDESVSLEEKTETEVEREKPTLRSLTQEEKDLFTDYIQNRTAKEQLINIIDNTTLAAYTGNVIITGNEGTETLTLCKNIVKEIRMSDRNLSGKTAKISGKALNEKKMRELIGQVENGALIIETASGISDEKAEELYQALQNESKGIVVIMEDNLKAMNKFLERNPKLAACFTNRMDVQALNNDTLVAYGKQYAYNMEYSIDELGILAFHTRIEERQTMEHAVTVGEVKEIVDKAIRHANRKTLGHFFDILLAKRYDEEDMIVLGEKDFS